MKPMRIVMLVALSAVSAAMLVSAALATAPNGSEPGVRRIAGLQLPARNPMRLDAQGVLLADDDEYQVPVREGVEPLDSPKKEQAQGNDEADIPAVQPPSSDVAPPAPDEPKNVDQPPLQP